MQNKTSNSSLIFIHGFILFIAFMFAVKGVKTITDIWNDPYEIAIPVNFTLEEAGKIKYQDGNVYDFRIRQAEGTVQYYPQNLDNAPIPIYNIFIRILSVLLPILVFFLLHKIMQTSIRQTPFDLKNVKRMRWIGIGLMVLGILTIFKRYNGLDFLANHVISDVISFSMVKADSAYNSGYMLGKFLGIFFRSELVLGCIALFGSEILRYGINLQQEHELTI